MRFWDSSAIVPLLTDEPGSAHVRALIERDEQMAVWWATPVECWSALARQRRKELITIDEEDRAGAFLDELQHTWYQVPPSNEMRRQAHRLVRVHPLRAADALQLAAAIMWSSRTDENEFVTFDKLLREAAQLEGLAVI